MEKSGKIEKVRESYNHHLAAAREKDITAFLSISYLPCNITQICIIKINLCIIKCQIVYLLSMTAGCKEYIGSSQFIGSSLVVLQLSRRPPSRLGRG